MFVFLLLVRESAEEKGDIRGREWTYVAISRRMGGRASLILYIYTPVSRVS